MVFWVRPPHPHDSDRLLGHHLRLRHQGLLHPEQSRTRSPPIRLDTGQDRLEKVNGDEILFSVDVRDRRRHFCRFRRRRYDGRPTQTRVGIRTRRLHFSWSCILKTSR